MISRFLPSPNLLSASLIGLCFTVWSIAISTVVRGQEPATQDKTASSVDAKDGWFHLVTNGNLDLWTKTNYGGEGTIDVSEDNTITFDMGDPMTGLTIDEDKFKEAFGEPLPTMQYEISWSANRLQGNDFFAGLTFPVNDSFCSFISGGWGGGVSGISCLNGNSAVENTTTLFDKFDNNRWYDFRLLVTEQHIKVFRDKNEIISIPTEKYELTVRSEVRSNRPLGYCVFQSDVAVRDFRIRKLP